MSIRPFVFCAAVILLSGILLSGCINVDLKDRRDHQDTMPICDRIYVETYKVSDKEDIRSNFLTDSMTFRVFVGSYHESNGTFSYTCKGDSIIAEKILWEKGEQKKIVNTKIFSLSKLQKKHSYLQ